MKIFDKLKNIFKFNKKISDDKLLPESTLQHTNDFKNSLRYGSINVQKQPTVEECVEEFIKQYRIQLELNPEHDNKKYKAYCRMFCDKEEDVGDNIKNQERLIKLARKYNCPIGFQTSNERMVFMHISGGHGLNEYEDNNMEKIYINCDRKDTAVITAAIFKKIKDIVGKKLQMKCVSEQMLDYGLDEADKELKNYQRNDRIVIYAENHEKALDMCNAISKEKRKHPKLFEGVKPTPLLENVDGFMVLADKNRHKLHVKTPVGDAAGRTFNDYVSDILRCSIISAFDKELGVDTGKYMYTLEERMDEYANIWPEVDNEEQRARIIKDSANLFRSLCKEADIKLYDNEYSRINNDLEK